MKFTVDRDSLMSALNAAGRALSNKTPMPILTGIKVEATFDNVVVTTSNGDLSMQVTINEGLKVEKPGTQVIPGRFFIEIIKKMTADSIAIESMDDNLINIRAGKSDFTLNGMENDLYPDIVFSTLSNPVILKVEDLRALVSQTNFATSLLENRPILTGVLFDVSGNKLRAVATDSYRLAQKEIELNISYDIKQIVIPHRTLEELSRILGVDSQIELFVADNKIIFKFNNVLFQSRLLEGRYPETNKLIPAEYPIEITFNKNELIGAIERASLLHLAGKDSIVKLKLQKNGSIKITSHTSEVGKVVEEIAPVATLSESEFNIAFSSKYVVEALRVFESNEVTMYFTGVVKPFVMKGELDEGLLQLVLPVRVE
jgi:DNA polymerase III subunit beta